MLRLNLLPLERKRAWELTQQFQRWRGALVVAGLACLLANAALYALDQYQNDQVAASATDLADWTKLNAKRESGQVTKTTTELNATVSGLQSIFSPISAAPGIVASFFNSLPSEITVTEAKFSSDGAFTFSGTATTRAAFLALRASLEANPAISNVTTDSTASVREKVPFLYTGQLVLPQ